MGEAASGGGVALSRRCGVLGVVARNPGDEAIQLAQARFFGLLRSNDGKSPLRKAHDGNPKFTLAEFREGR